jgi:AAA+ superfamily predicted ATPase
MPKLPPPRFVINTPVGDIELDPVEIRDVWAYVADSVGVDIQDEQIKVFLGDSIETKKDFYHSKSYIGWGNTMMEVINRDYEIIRIGNYNSRMSGEASPIWLDEKIKKDGEETRIKIPHKMTMYLRSKIDGHGLVIAFYPYDTYELDIMYHFCSDSSFDYTIWKNNLKDHFSTEGIYKNQAVTASFDFLDHQQVSWKDIVLQKGAIDNLNRHVINFISNLEKYKDAGIRSSRGILLTGPPGTGKTLCCSILINQTDSTVIYVTRNAVTDRGQIDDLYKLARFLAPTLVVFEDIDTLGGIDREDADHPLLGEFLNCLAGVEENEGVITLATTNYPQNLDWALADRPGRFDVRINFGYPDVDARRLIFEKYLNNCEQSNIKYKSWAKKTEGYSGAYLRELAALSFMIATEKEVSLNNNIIEEAFAELESQRNLVAKEKNLVRTTEDTPDFM